ncbi:hypothetical protein O0544_16835 [Edwardsiella anguillarum]|nr:hypothetical protein [Edwardsiella anguillarum]
MPASTVFPPSTAPKTGRYDGGLVSLSPSARCPSARDVSEDIEIHDYLRAFLPQTGDCLYGDIASVAMTPDGHFIIDTLPSAPAISIVSGLGANGFKFATALGELVVRMATGAEPGYDLTPFRLSRFAPCADKQPKGRDSDTIRIIFDKNGNGVDNKLSIYIFYF